jgi:hypothetical protein
MNIIDKPESCKELDNDPILLDQVLEAYLDHTKYLKSGMTQVRGDPATGGMLSAVCKFEIPKSCYINDTGHFNSVEFNICYNQMMYYLIAKSVKHRLMSAFQNWSLADYFRKQLPDILIVNFKSRFKHPIQPRQFFGEVDFVQTKVSTLAKPIIYLRTLIRFYDKKKGYSEGETDLVIRND